MQWVPKHYPCTIRLTMGLVCKRRENIDPDIITMSHPLLIDKYGYAHQELPYAPSMLAHMDTSNCVFTDSKQCTLYLILCTMEVLCSKPITQLCTYTCILPSSVVSAVLISQTHSAIPGLGMCTRDLVPIWDKKLEILGNKTIAHKKGCSDAWNQFKGRKSL